MSSPTSALRPGAPAWTRHLALAAAAAVCVPIFVDLIRVWNKDHYAAHGMFVPLFSLFLVWSDRGLLRDSIGPGDRRGALVALSGLGVLALGYWLGSVAVRGLAVPLLVAGALLHCFGMGFLRRVAFPVAFLALMVPLPRAFVNAVSFDLQLFAAHFATAVLQTVGIPVYQEGIIIQMASITLQVAEICNGLRFLAALVVLSVAFAEVTQRTIARKLVLALSSIPIAILANAGRITAIAVAVHLWGPEAASGPIHLAIGKGVWVATILPLVLLGWLLRRAARPQASAHPAEPPVTV